MDGFSEIYAVCQVGQRAECELAVEDERRSPREECASCGFFFYAYNPTVDRFFVIHYNELGLKKGNRDYFENALCTNINLVLRDCGAERPNAFRGGFCFRLRRKPIYRRSKGGWDGSSGSRTLQRPGVLHSLWKTCKQNAWSLIEGRIL